ncbi:Hypothetical predicted protein [Cloeon dipterum]|uniref:Uncharacterized protein n=1 Tax=Cloeon dipterum TaxID=197152 RepID=A0A8S1DAK3_9INSE|nr:Hypothetical predicted protein [Cloeon dipterum]
MKWLGADPTSGGIENSATGILGNGHQTSPDMLRNPQNHHVIHDRWKVSPGKMQPQVMQQMQLASAYEMHQAAVLKQHQEQMVFMNTAMGTPPPHPSLVGQPHNRNGQIAQSTKKLWGMDEHQKDDKGGGTGGNILQHLGDPHQVWRDTTWSNSGELSENTFYKSSPQPKVLSES